MRVLKVPKALTGSQQDADPQTLLCQEESPPLLVFCYLICSELLLLAGCPELGRDTGESKLVGAWNQPENLP